MRVALITPTPYDLFASGPRALSAYLRANGHDTRLILLPGETGKYKYRENYIYQYPRSMMEDLARLTEDCDLVGVSFMSGNFDVALQATRTVQHAHPGTPVVWGGHHATVLPQQALEFVDLVCIGEGEGCLLELADTLEAGGDISGIENLCLKVDGETIINTIRPLIQDLDSLPFIDYSNEDHWVYDKPQQRLIPLDDEGLRLNAAQYPDRDKVLRYTYKAMITRGCPHHCAYCGAAHNHVLYKGQKVLRRRSVDNMMAEMRQVLDRYPFYEMFHMQDDVFFAAPTREIQAFASAYKERIDRPIRAQMSPTVINDAKFGAMIDAGLCFTELGLQTGTANTMALYKRGMSNEHLLRATEIITRYRDYLNTPDYHVILDCPWESPDDVVDTLRLIWKLPHPYNLLPSSLVFYPGTEFYERAKAEGHLSDEFAEVYRKHFTTPKGSYVNFLFFLSIFNRFPKGVVEKMAAKPLLDTFSREEFGPLFGMLVRMGENSRKVGRVARYAAAGKMFNLHNLRNIDKIANYWK